MGATGGSVGMSTTNRSGNSAQMNMMAGGGTNMTTQGT